MRYLLALFLITHTSYSADHSLTLKQAITRAMEQHSDPAIYRLAVDKAASAVKVAHMPFDPRLSLKLGEINDLSHGFHQPISDSSSTPYSHRHNQLSLGIVKQTSYGLELHGRVEAENQYRTEIAPQTIDRYSLGLSQTIWPLPRSTAENLALNVATLRLEQASLDHERVVSNLVFEISALYWKTLLAQMEYEVEQEFSDHAASYYQESKKNYLKGAISESHLLEIENASLAHQMEREKKREYFTRVRAKLALALNLEADAISLQEDIDTPHSKNRKPQDQALAQAKLKHLPSLIKAKEKEIAQAQADAERFKQWPQLVMGADWAAIAKHEPGESRSVRPDLSERSVYVAINYTIPVSSSSNPRWQEQRSAVARLQLEQEKLAADLEERVSSLYRQLESLELQRVLLAQRNEILAKRVAQDTERYKDGVITFREFADVRDDARKVALERYRCEVDIRMLSAELQNLLGESEE